MKQELYQKIVSKKEFSQLPEEDVEKAFSHFEKRQTSEEEKIRLTRELLHKVFGAFLSKKLLSLKSKDEEWILRKHLSTRERLEFYNELYKKLLKGLGKKISVIDLGAGVNGFSYKMFKKVGFDVNYIGVEAIGQLVNQMNKYFKKNLLNAKAIHLSLFNLGKLREIISKTKTSRVIFLFKVVDSLEMLDRDYSKNLILETSKLADRTVVSFATESMIKRKRFAAKRTWLIDFLEKNFEILDDFEIGHERYIVFRR
ncbi:MAG: hypothetical protein ABSG05_02225 [Candidatus Pacearchaeota archaeon]|jgi:hypothetical protein